MTTLMRLVYQTLAASLDCQVARAWPQEDPGLPSLTFRLKDWHKQEDGSARALIHVLARAGSPQEADLLAKACAQALGPLELRLTRASDEVEAATGHFVKSLDFETQLWQEAIQPLQLHVLTGGAWQPLPPDCHLRVEPARAQLASQSGLLLGQGLPLPIRIFPASLAIKGPAIQQDPAQAAIAAAFYEGRLLSIRLSRGQGPHSVQSACVEAFGSLPSGFEARLSITPQGG